MKRVFLFLVILASVVAAYTIYDYNRFENLRLQKAVEKGKFTSNGVKKRLDSLVGHTREMAFGVVEQIGSKDFSADELAALADSQLKQIDFISGFTIAFEPYAFDKERRLYSLFYQRNPHKITTVESRYDYTDNTLETSKWYTACRESGESVVTDPYYGEVSEELVFDYSLPVFRKDEQGKEQLYAVISYTIAPDDFTEVVNSMVQGNSGYAYLTNGEGLIITHPNRSYILKRRGLDFLDDTNENSLVEMLVNNQNGYLDYVSPYTGVESILFFETVELIDWKVAVVYSRTDLLGNPRFLEQKIIHIALAFSFLLMAIIIYFFNLHAGLDHHLWGIATMTSLILLGNIIVIWLIHLKIDYSEELEDRTRVYSANALSSFVDRVNYEQRLLGNKEYVLVPTGVFVNELVVTDSYNMSVSGKIWQKWPADHEFRAKTGFEFLQASPTGRSVIVELLSKNTLEDGSVLYTWKFNTTLRIFFDYNQYPLDQHYIDIKLIYPDMTDNIMLVPDFDSYEVLNPASRPGMSDIIFLPKHRIIASYFSFSSMDMKTFFGQDRFKSSSEFEVMEYNIVIKRRFITPFISFVIPFILGSAIIFFLLYSLNKNKDDRSGVTVMGVVQGMAALFFSMLLAHITIRNNIPTPTVTYLESFYFLIYVMIAMLILFVVMYSRSDRYKFLNYRDNLIVKIAYWPLLMGMLYIITLLKFY